MTRTLALAADAVVINVVLTITVTVVGLAISVIWPDTHLTAAAILAMAGVWIATAAVYFVAFWALAGQTVGMRILRLRVVDARGGGRPDLWHSVLRLTGAVLSAIPLCAGFLAVLFDERRRGWLDRIARTLVVYVAEEAGPPPPRPLRDQGRARGAPDSSAGAAAPG